MFFVGPFELDKLQDITQTKFVFGIRGRDFTRKPHTLKFDIYNYSVT
jgi:hypothetical protein